MEPDTYDRIDALERELETMKKKAAKITRRDLFAAAALTGLLARQSGTGGTYTEELAVRRAWTMADEMEAKSGSDQ